MSLTGLWFKYKDAWRIMIQYLSSKLVWCYSIHLNKFGLVSSLLCSWWVWRGLFFGGEGWGRFPHIAQQGERQLGLRGRLLHPSQCCQEVWFQEQKRNTQSAGVPWKLPSGIWLPHCGTSSTYVLTLLSIIHFLHQRDENSYTSWMCYVFVRV